MRKAEFTAKKATPDDDGNSAPIPFALGAKGRGGADVDGALKAAHAGSWTFDLVRNTVELAEGWYRLTGHAPGSIGSDLDSVLALVHPDDVAQVRKRIDDLSKGISSSYVSQYRTKFADGGYRWVMDRGGPTDWDSKGAVTRMAGIQLDMSDFRNMSERAARSDLMAAVGRLTGGIAHDLNNLLAVILGNAELLSGSGHLVPADTKKVDRIIRSCETGGLLVGRLLMFARQSPLSFEFVELSGFIMHLRSTIEELVGPKITLNCSTLDDEVWTLTDRAGLESSILNICTNARDAMPNGGSITFEVKPEVVGAEGSAIAYATLRITDTGIGMDDITKAKIFEPFYTTKEIGKGLGLGLATVYGFVQQCCGDISVESTEGQGTSFLIRLPLMAQKARPPAVPAAQPDRAPSKLVILVIDDNESIRNTLAEQLSANGHTVLLASNIEEAESHLNREDDQKPQFVICDFDLGERETGADLAERLQHRGIRLPGILISGYFDISTDRVASLGWSVLRKPYAQAALNDLIAIACPFQKPHPA